MSEQTDAEKISFPPPGQVGVDPGLVAAYLSSRGWEQRKIAAGLGINGETLSRASKRYTDSVWLELNPAEKLRSDLEKVKLLYGPDKPLQERIHKWRTGKAHWWLAGSRLLVTVVQPADSRKFPEEASDRLLRLMLELRMPAAEFGSCAYAGVFYGKSLREITDAIASHPERNKIVLNAAGNSDTPARHLRFIPVCGDPCYSLSRGIAKNLATELAWKLQECLGGRDSSEQPALMGVPAYMPPEMNVPPYWESFPGYVRIFGEVQPDGTRTSGLAEEIEILLTGVGIIDPAPVGEDETGIFVQERCHLTKKSRQEVNELAYGALMGLLIPREGHEARVAALNQGWTGLSKERLLRLADKKWKSRPGLVLVARGQRRASLIKAVLDQGFPVGELIIDLELFEALESL